MPKLNIKNTFQEFLVCTLIIGMFFSSICPARIYSSSNTKKPLEEIVQEISNEGNFLADEKKGHKIKIIDYDGTKSRIKVSNRHLRNYEKMPHNYYWNELTKYITPEEPLIKKLSEVYNLNDLERIIDFVGHIISYDKDYSYYQYPIETIMNGNGACRDFVSIVASFTELAGYDIAILRIPGINHLALGVTGYYSGSRYEYNGKFYYYAEVTGQKWPGENDICPIGTIPFNGDLSAYIYPITDENCSNPPDTLDVLVERKVGHIVLKQNRISERDLVKFEFSSSEPEVVIISFNWKKYGKGNPDYIDLRRDGNHWAGGNYKNSPDLMRDFDGDGWFSTWLGLRLYEFPSISDSVWIERCNCYDPIAQRWGLFDHLYGTEHPDAPFIQLNPDGNTKCIRFIILPINDIRVASAKVIGAKNDKYAIIPHPDNYLERYLESSIEFDSK